MSIPSHYHEPESRLQQRDKLQHLVRFSDFVILIIGPDGVGKSALLEQLIPDERQNLGRAVRLQLDETTDVTNLLQQLTQALDFEPAADNRQRLKQIHLLARQLQEDELSLILLIDDADFLTNNALELLVNFATFEKGVPPRVLLTGTADFEERFRGLGLAEKLERHLHVEQLEPFTEDEAAEYIESLLPESIALNKRQLAAVVERTQGYPGRLREQAVELLRSGSLKPAGSSAFPLPPRHISAAVLVLLLVFGVAVWQYLPEDDAGPVVAERITLPLPAVQPRPLRIETLEEQQANAVATPVASASDVSRQPEPVVESAVQPVIQPSAEPSVEPVVDVAESAVEPAVETVAPSRVTQTPPPQAPVASEPIVAANAPAVAPTPAPKPEPKPAPKPEPKPAPEPAPKPEPKPAPEPASVAQAGGVAQQWLREDELLGWPEQGYTLQVMGARAESSVRDFIQAQAEPQRFYYFRTVFKGAPWHVVVYGQYADRAAATNAVASLPESLRKLRPWARSIAGVKADIRKR